MTHYSFTNRTLKEVVAHDGIGVVATERVAGPQSHCGLNFIDLTIIPPGNSIGAHRHGSNDEEVYVIISGSGTMTVEDRSFSVEPGDVIVNPPNGRHSLANTGTEPMRIVVIDVPT